ncbi:hypothetical protein C922_01599 [Plasmodium inui San Antonio 1]|uniref:Uncharacterized protein n=1 Tax=Plasmodium inui San Antonio 1 TaxID=1237626 RepID=W7A3W9_9APIC|nr:hypothetical protein C922_01599 [Plasmodium inui San Antonio 1]EUD67987.1 hypothetical protein C922_01599 [Plasmodium inui San Antonio 1]
MTKMARGIFPQRRGKRCNDIDARSCRTRKRASYIHRCLNLRKLQKCEELRKMKNYCLYVNLKEMLNRSYCKGNASNTNGSCLKVTAPPAGEINEEGETNPHHGSCKCASHTFDNCYITGLHIFEGIFLTSCSGGIVSIFDKNLNNILSRRVATSPIKNISMSKKENALCFADSSNHLYVVHLNRKNMCKGSHFNISKRGSYLDESPACASTPYGGDDKILNSFNEDEKNTFLNDKQYANLTKKEKTIAQSFLYNNISSYNVKNLNCCVINPYFDHHQNNSICVLTSNKIVSVLNIFEFHINNSVLFRGQHILSLHWHSLYVFICTDVSIFVVNFFDKTKIAHVVLDNLEIIEKIEVGQAGRLSGEKNVKANVSVNHNGAEMNTCSDKVDATTNEPQMMCEMESIHICELQKGEYTIARGKNVKIVKIEKKNGIEKISISNEFDVHNSIISISPYYDPHQNGFPDNEVCLSVITALGGTLYDGVNDRTCTHLEHMILTKSNYLMCNNYLYMGGAEKDTITKKCPRNTWCKPYPGGEENWGRSTTRGGNRKMKMASQDATSCDGAGNSHPIDNSDGARPITNLFQYMKITPNWGQRKGSGAIQHCLYIYGENTLLQFRSKTVTEFFSEVIKKKAKNGRNIFLLLDALKRQPICRKELTEIGLCLINAFIKQTNYFIAAHVFILLCNRFCDKYRVIYNVMEMFSLRKHMHILSLFYRKLKEESTHQKGNSSHSCYVDAVSDKRRRFITRGGTIGEGKKIKSALYILHLYYVKNGRKRKKTKRDKERLNYEWKKKKMMKKNEKNTLPVQGVEKKKNFLFFATKKLFNQFLVFLLLTDAYEFRKVYEISSAADLNPGMLVKHIVLFLQGDLSLLKKRFVRTGGDGCSSSIGSGARRAGRSTSGTPKWAGRPHNSDRSSESCDRGTRAKKKKNEPPSSSNNGDVTNNGKTGRAGEEDKVVKKNLPAAWLQESNKGCTTTGKKCRSNRYNEKSAWAEENKLANDQGVHRNEHRSKGRIIPHWEQLSAPLRHQRDADNEGDQRDDEKNNTYLSMEFRRDHAEWGSDRDGGIERDRNSKGVDGEKTPRGPDPQTARQPRQEEKRMKRRSCVGGGPNRPRHNSNGTDEINTVTLSNLTSDYFSSAAHCRSAPLTFENLAEDSSPKNLIFFEKEFDNVKKMEIIKMLIRRKNKKVFAYLKQCRWQVLKKVTERFILKLFRLSKIKTAKLLVIVKVKEKNKYRYFFNPKDVIKRLKEKPFLLYTYLKHVKDVKYLSRYIHLFLFLMFIFEPLLLVRFLAKHYRCVSFKRVLFFICFFDRVHIVGEVTPIEGAVTGVEITPVEEAPLDEEVKPVEKARPGEEVTPVEESPPRRRPAKSKSSLFRNERVMLLYRYLLDEQVEKEKLEELFNYIKQPSEKRPREANFFLSVKAFMYVKFGYINKALTLYQQLSNYDEIIYLVKIHNVLIDDAVMEKAEHNLASLNGAPFLSGLDGGFLHGRHVCIASARDVSRKEGDGGDSSPRMGSNDDALTSAGAAERKFRLRRGKKKTSKREEDAQSVFASNSGDVPDGLGGVHPSEKPPRQTDPNCHYAIDGIDRVNRVDAMDEINTYVRRNAHFANLDKEIMLSLYAQREGNGRRKGDSTRRGKRNSNRMEVHRSSSGGSSPSRTHKQIILKKHLINNSSREMHYLTLMFIMRELFYISELSDNYNRILMRCKANTYNRFNEIKKKGYVIYNGVIKKEMKNNNLYFLDINDYYFINDKMEDKRSNQFDMIMPYMDEHNGGGLVERNATDKEQQELPLHIQKEVPSNYYFYDQIHDKPYVSFFSSFCSICQHNIYLDSCAFDGERRCRSDSVVFFFCNHLYHLKCLRERGFICLACH